MQEFDRKIVIEDGSEYFGYGFGSNVDRVCEIVFNTSMVGYQEIVSDPSYTDQMVVMTYPLIGNYEITDDDYETKIPTLGGLIVYDYNDMPSNFRYTKTLSELLEENGIPGISGVDTRKITRSIRDLGSREGSDHFDRHLQGRGSGDHQKHALPARPGFPRQLQKTLVQPHGRS